MRVLTRLLASPLVAWPLLLLPIVGFTVYFFLYRLDIPWFDDFESIPYFLQRFVDARTGAERWEALLRPNNEHRLVYARLVVYLYYLVTGTISFQNLMLIGNAGLLVILFLFYRSIQRAGMPWWYLLPVPFLLLTAQNYLLTFTALYALQYLAILMLVLLALYQLANNTRTSYGIAMALAVFSTFSMGNGMLVWVAGVVVLFYQKQWLRMAGWSVVAAASVALYFYGYPVQQGNQDGFAFFLTHPLQVIQGFFVYTGSLFDLIPGWSLDQRTYLPLLMGTLIIGFLAYWSIRLLFFDKSRPTHWNAFLLGCVVFLVVNTLIVALFRTRFGFMMVLWSTYRTYILVLSAVVYLIIIGAQRPIVRAQWVPALLIVAMAVNLISYITYLPEVSQRRNQMQAQAFNQRYNQLGLGGSRTADGLADFIVQCLNTMQQRGWYQLPPSTITAAEKNLLTTRLASAQMTPATMTIHDQADYIMVSTKHGDYTPSWSKGLYLVAKSDRRTYLITVLQNPPAGRNPFRNGPGFTAPIPKQLIQPGRYSLGLYYVDNSRGSIHYTNQTIAID